MRIVINQPFRRLLQLRLRQQRLRLRGVDLRSYPPGSELPGGHVQSEVVELCHAPHLRRLFPSGWSAWGTRHMRIVMNQPCRRLLQRRPPQQRLRLRGVDLRSYLPGSELPGPGGQFRERWLSSTVPQHCTQPLQLGPLCTNISCTKAI